MPRLVFIKTTREMASINFDCNRLIIYFLLSDRDLKTADRDYFYHNQRLRVLLLVVAEMASNGEMYQCYKCRSS
jgi:hypothetical protein